MRAVAIAVASLPALPDPEPPAERARLIGLRRAERESRDAEDVLAALEMVRGLAALTWKLCFEAATAHDMEAGWVVEQAAWMAYREAINAVALASAAYDTTFAKARLRAREAAIGMLARTGAGTGMSRLT